MAQIMSQARFISLAIASALAVPVIGWGLSQGAIAQTPLPCDPPSANEYLLMVVYRSADAQAQLEQALPPTTTTTVCDYLGTTVTRVGGFTDPDVANSWAQFLSDIGGLQAFVARPVDAAPVTPAPSPAVDAAGEPVPIAPQPFPSPTPQPEALPVEPSPGATAAELSPTPEPPSTPTPQLSPEAAPTPTPAATPAPEVTLAYNPQVLGTGYAVLVDYFNRPEIATQLRQVLTTPVGVVSYEQRPYLLAIYTADLTAAATLLQTLSDRNFSAVIVDGRRTVLLSPRAVTE